MSIVQLSRFFLCSVSSDSFYILSKALSFVKNFFNFFHFLFCGAFSQRVSSYIISFVSVFVKNFFDFFQKLFWYYFDTLFSCFPNYGLQFSPNIRQDFSRIKRRRRDLNPRAGFPTYTLSRGASSASWVFLLILNPTVYTAFFQFLLDNAKFIILNVLYNVNH